jgi:SAM-dependent methyltransferase
MRPSRWAYHDALPLPRPLQLKSFRKPMTSTPMRSRSDADLLRTNREFYEGMWTDARLVLPQRFNTWPLVDSLLPLAPRRLEVAPGLRPRLPIQGTQFIDISLAALTRLRACGASAVLAQVSSIPFADASFDLVCACDIVEHVDDDDGALAELSRVAAAGADLLLSVPLHPAHWTAFDEMVGHRRRYEPRRLVALLSDHGFAVERSAVYGMRPRSSRVRDLGMWWLEHYRERAMWWYNRVFMPLGVRMQKTLSFQAGMIDRDDVDEVLLVCRRN